jgi:hypothetical protein
MGSERQAQAYLSKLSRQAPLSLGPADPRAIRVALTQVLRTKGRVLETAAGGMEALRRAAAPEDRALLDGLVARRAQLARLEMRGPGPDPPERHRQILGSLRAEVEELERKALQRGGTLRVAAEPVRLEAVQGADSRRRGARRDRGLPELPSGPGRGRDSMGRGAARGLRVAPRGRSPLRRPRDARRGGRAGLLLPRGAPGAHAPKRGAARSRAGPLPGGPRPARALPRRREPPARRPRTPRSTWCPSPPSWTPRAEESAAYRITTVPGSPAKSASAVTRVAPWRRAVA